MITLYHQPKGRWWCDRYGKNGLHYKNGGKSAHLENKN